MRLFTVGPNLRPAACQPRAVLARNYRPSGMVLRRLKITVYVGYRTANIQPGNGTAFQVQPLLSG